MSPRRIRSCLKPTPIIGQTFNGPLLTSSRFQTDMIFNLPKLPSGLVISDSHSNERHYNLMVPAKRKKSLRCRRFGSKRTTLGREDLPHVCVKTMIYKRGRLQPRKPDSWCYLARVATLNALPNLDQPLVSRIGCERVV